MKTLIISLEYPPQIGGIASHVFNMASHMPNDVVVVWAPKMNGDKEYDAKQSWKTYRGVAYYSFFWPRWLKMYWQIKKIVKEEKIERIFVNHVLPVGYIAKMILKTFKIPYSIFLHGTDLKVALKHKRSKLLSVAKSAERIFVNSEFMKAKFIASIPGCDNKINIIYPCPGDSFFQSASKEQLSKLKSQLALDGKKVMLTVSRMVDGKGYPHLASIFSRILEKVPNAVWLIVGDGAKREEVLKQLQKNNVQNSVRYLGNVEYSELPLYYQISDLFVLLTHKDEVTEEGWGTVFLEASASHLPVVAGRSGGVEEAVVNNETGYVVDVNQEEACIKAIVELLQSEELMKKMGEAGYTRAIQQFNWQTQVEKIV